MYLLKAGRRLSSLLLHRFLFIRETLLSLASTVASLAVVLFTVRSLTAVNRVLVCCVLSVALPELCWPLLCRSADSSIMLLHISLHTWGFCPWGFKQVSSSCFVSIISLF